MPWRLYQKADLPSVEALQIEMEARVKEHFDLPALDERPTLIALVYERDGVITHAALLEAQAEFMAMGESALPHAEWEEANRLMSELCKVYDLNFVRAFVPNAALVTKKKAGRAPVERMLSHFGFVREDQSRITAFTRKMS